ncbi:hypothetical protein N7493_001295 [Penicillium malachiteum]|uniref:NmrA-like domain-containing protein n=1 Tax=Penicillium malachiteum TaxID=1324776 RepID=A0AAD6HUW3_9EURO|nr:hypothetical protein N7493_001295 [Penicillium malachiteum]
MTGSKPLITVYGATGNQGGSVARSLLRNPSFRVRGITRNVDSKASQLLKALGTEMVQGDGFDQGSMEAAFSGAWGAFVNMNSDDKIFTNPDGPTEFDMGKIVVDAAAKGGVETLVFSSGPPCTEMTKGKVSMKAMDMKYRIEQYARGLGVFKTITPINPGWFMENFLFEEVAPIFGGFPYVEDGEGFLTFRVPRWGGKENVPFLSVVEDFGDIVQGIFLQPQRWNGHVVHGLSDIRSFDELVDDFARVTGKKARYLPVLPSWEAFDIKGIHELQDVKLMFGFTQNTGGLYFGLEPTEGETAAQLKTTTAAALGRIGSESKLISTLAWFSKSFGNK